MSKKFIDVDRSQAIKIPGNMKGWLNGNNLARFIVDIVEQLDTSELENDYRKGGSAAYPPKMILALLFYCYAKGIFSSRKIEQSSYELIPVLYITGGLHPDHDTINKFRKRFLGKLAPIFIMILQIAHDLGVLKLGDISIDGTKIEANASKHKAMSWDYANKLEAQLQAEVEELLKRAEKGNGFEDNDINIPVEIQYREARLNKITEIKAEIEKRAQERYEQEQAEYEKKLEERKKKEAERGRKLGGKKPTPPEPGPRGKDQVSFTDGDSRIMPKSGGGFVQAYNAQASVDQDTILILGQHVSQNTNDKQEVEPALVELNKLPEELGKIERAALDTGYFSESNVDKIIEKQIEPYIASGRQSHNQTLEERLAKPPKVAEDASSVEKMQHRMKTEEGKNFYAKRKSTVETTFGIIKGVIGFRHFMLRGIEAVKGEWTLVSIAYNLKRLCVLSA